MEANRELEGEGVAEDKERQPSYKIMTVEEFEQEKADMEKHAQAAKERQEQAAKEAAERAATNPPTPQKPAHLEKPVAAGTGGTGISEAAEGSGKDNSTRYFLIIAAVIVVLTVAVFSIRALKSEQKYETVTYNGFVFEQYAGLWNTQWKQDGQLFNLRLHYNPYQVENVSIIGEEGWSAGESMFITFDPEEGEKFSYTALAAAELSLSLNNAFGITPVAACTENITAGCASRPVVGCGSAPANSSVIYLKEGSPAEITLQGGCATIQGRGEELVRAAEKAIYQWYGIIRAA
ncbi:hypothetical protein HYV82_06800 [Candidatus Woesearchaeota archaeon]|nr:hypothetical protein [Candidatus Woesearchaeota archaeon]